MIKIEGLPPGKLIHEDGPHGLVLRFVPSDPTITALAARADEAIAALQALFDLRVIDDGSYLTQPQQDALRAAREIAYPIGC